MGKNKKSFTYRPYITPDPNNMKFRCALFLLLSLLPSLLGAQGTRDPDSRLPLFEMEEMEVLYSPTDFSPSFKGDSPQLSYFDIPTLPHGDLIVALEFMDRYRDTLVPGQVKWAGMVHFPVIDGRERWYLKWICLYFYDDRMYGFDPGPEAEWQRRFTVPIRYEDRRNPDALYRFASNYVETAFPETQEEYYYVETADPTDPDASFEEVWETIDIPAGRIDGFLSSHKGKEAKDLVRIVYEHSEMPNPGTGTEAAMGKAKGVGRKPFTWAGFFADLTAYTDHIEQAADMLKPRWAQPVKFHYDNKFLFWDIKARSSGLLFNIGTRIYTYSPRYGVWRTTATIYVVEDLDVLASQPGYPGVEKVKSVEFINRDEDIAGN